MALRLRLKFQRGVLSNSQRSDGLNRSWIFLTPYHETISDVVSHLLHTFDLHDACPNGVLLSMDGFVLPPFETTNILRDKDLIWVKRKGVKLVDVVQEYKQQSALLEHIPEKKQGQNPCLQLLPNGEFGKETGGYESETEEDEDEKKQTDVLQEEIMPYVDVPVKKRKASKELQTPKRKRQHQVLHENDEQEAEKEHDGACLLNGDLSKKSSKNKQDHIPEFDGKNPGSVPHKANAKEKRQRQDLHDNDEQEAQKGHNDACLLDGDLSKKSSKNKQDHIPESNGENLGSVKHKANTKKKRHRQVLHDCDEQEAQKEHDDACLLDGDLSKKSSKNKQDHIPEFNGENLGSAKHKANTNNIDENGEGTLTPDPSNRTGQSRSARRKKAKREWKRMYRLSEKEQLLKKQSVEEDLKADLGSNKDQNLDTENQPPEPESEVDEGSDTEDDVVAVMIGPGHFRFTAPGKEKDVEHNDVEKESFNWSGITNKRKGQKWGRGNQSASKWNENKAPYENQSSPKRDECISPTDQQSDPMQNDSITPSSNHATQEAPLENASIDYEKLAPMTDSPLEGDIIAYRLVELTSSFCPELTDYRIGKVSWFEAESNRIMLFPVPQYPFELIKTAEDDTSEELPGTSSYNEDGSLEIEFQSLVDVRIVKRGEVSLTPAVQHEANGAPAVQQKANGVPASGLGPPSGSGLGTEPHGKAPSTQTQSLGNNETGVNNSASAPEPGCNPENGTKDAWEEISTALSAKKAELLEDNWNKKRAPWSHRAMRSSALGPTLAILRAQNHHQTK